MDQFKDITRFIHRPEQPMSRRAALRAAGCGFGMLGLAGAALTPGALASSRLKTDVVYMKNGDKITCEIRSLEQAQLTIKQDYANSTVVLDWSKADRLPDPTAG